MINYVYTDTKFCISTKQFIKDRIAANTPIESSIMRNATISISPITKTPAADPKKQQEKDAKEKDTEEKKAKDKKSQKSIKGKFSKWINKTTATLEEDIVDTAITSSTQTLKLTTQRAKDAYENLPDAIKFLPEEECITQEQKKLLLNPSTQISKARACMWQGINKYNQK